MNDTLEDRVYGAVHEEIMKLRVKLHDVLNGRSDIDAIVYHAQHRAADAAVAALLSPSPAPPPTPEPAPERLCGVCDQPESEHTLTKNVNHFFQRAPMPASAPVSPAPVDFEAAEQRVHDRVQSAIQAGAPFNQAALDTLRTPVSPAPQEEEKALGAGLIHPRRTSQARARRNAETRPG